MLSKWSCHFNTLCLGLNFDLAFNMNLVFHLIKSRSLELVVCITFFASAIFAGNKLLYLPTDKKIPEDTFIFAIYNIVEQKVHIGTAKAKTGIDDGGKPTGGIRNGGHAALAFKALRVKSIEDFNQMSPPSAGILVGGGFINGSDGFTHVHQYMSLKAAGSTGYKIKTPPGTSETAIAYDNLINPRLPVNSRNAMIPKDYDYNFLKSIVLLTGKPIKIDQALDEFSNFKFNSSKHDLNKTKLTMHKEVGWAPVYAARINWEIFNIPYSETLGKNGELLFFSLSDYTLLSKKALSLDRIPNIMAIEDLFQIEDGKNYLSTLFLELLTNSQNGTNIAIIRSVLEALSLKKHQTPDEFMLWLTSFFTVCLNSLEKHYQKNEVIQILDYIWPDYLIMPEKILKQLNHLLIATPSSEFGQHFPTKTFSQNFIPIEGHDISDDLLQKMHDFITDPEIGEMARYQFLASTLDIMNDNWNPDVHNDQLNFYTNHFLDLIVASKIKGSFLDDLKKLTTNFYNEMRLKKAKDITKQNPHSNYSAQNSNKDCSHFYSATHH